MTRAQALTTLQRMRSVYIARMLDAKSECMRLANEFEIGVRNELVERISKNLSPFCAVIDDCFTDAFFPTEAHINSDAWPSDPAAEHREP